MNRNDAKRLLSFVSIIVFLGGGSIQLVSFAPLFEDEEFDQALEWAEQVGIPDPELIEAYPFSFIKREEAARRYVSMAQSAGMTLYDNSICTFDDLDEVTDEVYVDYILTACGYRFFWGAKGGFHPEEYVTKAMSLVALMKGFYPKRTFEESEPYRDPFVNTAYELGITNRKSDPYMMYLVTRYELLLELYRAHSVYRN